MQNKFTVKFYWDGHEYMTHYFAEILPKDESEANVLAWGAIRKWFEDQNLSIPKLVRNVSYFGDETYNWDAMSLASSADGLK